MARLALAAVLVATQALAAEPGELDALRAATCEADRTYCFAIHLHVAPDVITPDWMTAQLAVANTHFAAISASFEITAVDAKAPETVVTRADRAALKPQVTGRVIHVFVTGSLGDVDAPGKEIRGVALKKGDTKYIILSAKAPDRVLTHELGHLFLLPHSTYPISIMNKTERAEPPLDQRTFAPEEVVTMKAAAKRFVQAKILANRRPKPR